MLARQYPESLIDRSIEKARKIPRQIALLKVKIKEKEKQPIFAVKYDPRMPALQPMLAKHYRSMVSQDTYLKQCFPKPPLTAFRRQNNLRNFLIKSKLPPPYSTHPRRNLNGMKKCGRMCQACPYVKEGKEVKINQNSIWKIERRMTCESYNVIYMLDCEKCGEKYIGSTIRQLKHRVADHRGYISNQVTSRATGAHWNLPGHSLAHMKVTILYQSKSRDKDYVRESEKYLIRKFDTMNSGIGREW